MKKITANDLFAKLEELSQKEHKLYNLRSYRDGSGYLCERDERIFQFDSLKSGMGEFGKRLGPSKISVILNDEYSAIISKSGIAVGCQTISFERFDGIAEAVAKLRPKSRIGQKVPFCDVKIGEKIMFDGNDIIYTRTDIKPYFTLSYIGISRAVIPAAAPRNSTTLVTIVE